MPINLRDTRGLQVDAGNAIDWEHPLNKGRIAWFYSPAGVPDRGQRVLNLCGRNHGTLVLGASSTDFVGRFGDGLLVGTQTGNTNGANISTAVTPGTQKANRYAIAGSVFSSATNIGQGFFGFRPNNGIDDNSFYVNHLSTGLTEIRYRGSGQTTGTDSNKAYSVGWTRYLVFVSGTTMQVYANGVLNDTITVNAAMLTATTPFWMLRTPFNASFPASAIGPIRDVSVWTGDQMVLMTPGMAQLDYRQSINRYQLADSPLRWFSTRSYFQGVTIVNGFGTTTGAATAAGVGASSYQAFGTLAGLGVAAGVGASSVSAVGSAAGAATFVGSGASSYSATGSSTGASSVSGTGASIIAAIAAATGLSTLSGIGRSIINAIGAIFGTSTAVGYGQGSSSTVKPPITRDRIDFARTITDEHEFQRTITDELEFPRTVVDRIDF